jgi:hypothetical protein
MSHVQNIRRIKVIAQALQELNDQVVFVGGAAVSLYGDDYQMPDHRPTDDIDVIVEMTTYGKYARIQERLRELGFREDHSSTVICRWIYQELIVDIMPLNDQLWGFTNQWYEKAFVLKEVVFLDEATVYRLPAPCYLLTKWEALKNRQGGVDWRWSQDFEDMLKIMAGTTGWQDTTSLNEAFKTAYFEMLRTLIEEETFFYEAARTQLNPNFYSDQRIDDIIVNIKNLLS